MKTIFCIYLDKNSNSIQKRQIKNKDFLERWGGIGRLRGLEDDGAHGGPLPEDLRVAGAEGGEDVHQHLWE